MPARNHGHGVDPTTTQNNPILLTWSAAGVAEVTPAAFKEARETSRSVAWIIADGNGETQPTAASLALRELDHFDDVGLLAILESPDRSSASVDGPGVVTTVVCRHRPGPAGGIIDEWPLRIVVGQRWVLAVAWGADALEVLKGLVSSMATADSRPGDLGLELLLGAAQSLDSTARAFARNLTDGPPASEAQRDTAAKRLDGLALDAADVRRSRYDPTNAWFAEQDGTGRPARIAAVLDTARTRAEALAAEERRQLDALRKRERESRRDSDQRRRDSDQLIFGVLAALFIGPTLIAGIFDAFPGWLPQPRRDDVMLSLSLASAGAIGLLVALLPVAVHRNWRNVSRPRWILATVAALAMVMGLAFSFPLDTGVDAQAPQVEAVCPANPMRLGAPATATVVATDPEEHLVGEASTEVALDTSSPGRHSFSARARDSFGNTASATCAFVVAPKRK